MYCLNLSSLFHRWYTQQLGYHWCLILHHYAWRFPWVASHFALWKMLWYPGEPSCKDGRVLEFDRSFSRYSRSSQWFIQQRSNSFFNLFRLATMKHQTKDENCNARFGRHWLNVVLGCGWINLKFVLICDCLELLSNIVVYLIVKSDILSWGSPNCMSGGMLEFDRSISRYCPSS